MVRESRSYGGAYRVVRWIDGLTFVCGVIAAFCLAGIFVLIMMEVGARNFLGTSVDFSWDYASYLMGAAFMLASGAALHSGAHVRVTVLREPLSTAGRRRVDLAAAMAGLAVIGILLWSICSMAWLSAERGSTSATVVRTPLWIPQVVMAFGAAVFFLQMVAQIIRLASGQVLTGDEAAENSIDE